MSRTWKTRPMQVRLWDDLEKVAYHVCKRSADCDLPKSLKQNLLQTGPGHCKWLFTYTGVNVCACQMCYGQDWLKLSKRADRRRVNAFLSGNKNAAEDGVWEDMVLDSDRRTWQY